MEETQNENQEPIIPIQRPKRSSLKVSNQLLFKGLENLNVKKRNSVSFNMPSHLNFDKLKTQFDNIEKTEENEENKEKKEKFNEMRRQSVKNEFSLVKELLKKKNDNTIEEIEESDDEEIKENTKKNIEEGKKNLEESENKSSNYENEKENEKKDQYIIDNIIQLSFFNVKSQNLINKEVYNKLKVEKENLEKKISQLKNIMEELKIRFDLEISKRDGRITSLKEQNDNLQNIVNKYNLFQINLKKEKSETQSQLIKQIKKTEQLNEKCDQLNLLLKMKNDQIETNNKYSIELIRIVNSLKDKVDKDKNQRKQNQIVNNLNKEIQQLKKQLQTNKSVAIGLEAKNKILENNYRSLSHNYNELKNLKEKEKEEFKTSEYNLNFLNSNNKKKENKIKNQYYYSNRTKTPIYLIDNNISNENLNNNKKNNNYINNNINNNNINSKGEIYNTNDNDDDKLLISEGVLPKIISNSNSAKDYKSMKNYSQIDIYHTQHDITHINQLMSEIISDINE
jgi:hypothetical protein